MNTFAPLRPSGAAQPLPAHSFDIFSPIGRMTAFRRQAWGSVDVAEHLPAGELVIGLNPPFGFRNGQALEFVEHSLCASPRMIVLIIPTTDGMLNYEPPGYETLIRDEGSAGNKFYTPGAEGRAAAEQHQHVPHAADLRGVAPHRARPEAAVPPVRPRRQGARCSVAEKEYNQSREGARLKSKRIEAPCRSLRRHVPPC